jgi:cysteinyl-tRNA synthetase
VALDEVRSTPLPAAFAAAMDDDLNVPAALAVVHEHVTAGNTAYADGGPDDVRASLVAVRGMLDVLGLDPAQWESAEDGPRALRAHRALGALVTAELAVRQEARATKDWAAADAVRDRLAAAGIAVEDSPTGPRWSLAEEG